MSESKNTKILDKTGSITGMIICIIIGFAFYFGLTALGGNSTSMDYGEIVSGIENSFTKQVIWLFMNFTEAQFYASAFAGAGVILGGAVAYILAIKGSKYKGFDICYGSSTMFPWVLASQVISVGLAIFVFQYVDILGTDGITWAATFISIVGAPPAVMLLYGPSIVTLLTSSILGGLICAPTAFWIGNIISTWNIPGVVANVSTMAITGIVICIVCKALPFIKKVDVKAHVEAKSGNSDVHSTSWFIRRVLAEFSEAQFYGNEVAGIFVLLGVSLGTIICQTHGAYGSGAVPAIILSQFVGGAVGVFLYADKFDNSGWYATYVPVVSVGPACVLMFGSTIPVALFAGVLGGIIGGPTAEAMGRYLPEGVHGTVANVTAMAVCTIITAVVMTYLPCF